MTQNQIAYHNAKETERHNKMMEQETNRHQLAEEAIKARANAIQAAANYVTAVHFRNMDTENQRSNLAHEYLTSRTIMETSRHNRATERLTESLNASLIKRNEKEASYISANTGYIQELTKTQAEKTKQAASEAKSAEIGIGTAQYERMAALNKSHEIAADTALKRAQATESETRQFLNYVSAINQASLAVKNVVGSTGDVFRFIFGEGGVQTMQNQNMDWYNSTGSTGSQFGDYLSGGVDVETFTGNPNYYQ